MPFLTLVEGFCVVICIALNVICYLVHRLDTPERWRRGRRCACPTKFLFVTNRKANADVEHESYFALSSLDGNHLTSSLFFPRPWLLLLRLCEVAFFASVVIADGTTGDKFGTETPWPAFFTSWTFVLFGLWAVSGASLTATDLWREKKTKKAGEGEHARENGASSEWRERGGGAPPSPSSLPTTPQRGRGKRSEVEDVEEAAEDKKAIAASLSPAPTSVAASTSSSADSTRPLTRREKKSQNENQQRERQEEQQPPLPMTLHHKLHSLLCSVAGPAAVFVAVIYWVVLRRYIEIANAKSEVKKPFDPVDAMLHGGNAFFVLLDLFLSRVPACSSHFQLTLGYATAYAIFIWIWEKVTHRYVYGRLLAWHRPTAVAFYGFALPGALLACFVLWYGVALGREALGVKLDAKRRRGNEGGEQAVVSASPSPSTSSPPSPLSTSSSSSSRPSSARSAPPPPPSRLSPTREEERDPPV